MSAEPLDIQELRSDYGLDIQWINTSRLKPNPRNAEIYRNDDTEELSGKIRESNWIKPLVATSEFLLVSGHRRLKAAQSLGIKRVPVEIRDFENDEALLEALLLENFNREKTPLEKVREAQKWHEIESEKAKKRQLATLKTGSLSPVLEVLSSQCDPPVVENFPQRETLTKTRDAVAEKVGFGTGKTYEKAAKVVALADDFKAQGKAEESEAILKVLNEKSVDAAYQIFKAPEEDRATVAEKIVKGEAKSVPHANALIRQEKIDTEARFENVKPSVTEMHWREWLPSQPPCDLLFTDPPYSTDVENIAAFASEWLPVALGKVKPTGRAYVCIGAYPDELAAYFAADRAGMTLAQVLVWTYRNTMGPSPTFDYKLNWQAILYFRGPEAGPLDCPLMNEQFSVQDLNAPDGRLGDRYHAWQKPDALAERLIRHSTKKGDLILDPFTGTGTFLLAANRLGRVGRGCEVDPAMLKIAEQRGCQIA